MVGCIVHTYSKETLTGRTVLSLLLHAVTHRGAAAAQSKLFYLESVTDVSESVYNCVCVCVPVTVCVWV